MEYELDEQEIEIIQTLKDNEAYIPYYKYKKFVNLHPKDMWRYTNFTKGAWNEKISTSAHTS